MDILEIELCTDNLQETEIFYTKILGLQLTYKSEDKISLQAGTSIISFIKSLQLNPTYHFAFNIPCNQLEDSIHWFSAKIPLIQIEENNFIASFESWNAQAIYFYDNNGNILEFIARFDLQNDAENYFDHHSILSISEIGIVTIQPKIDAEILHEKFNIPYFEKGTQSEKFSILGNDHGLLIIVETNRIWYPTASQAENFHLKIKLQIDGLHHEFIGRTESKMH